MEDAERIEKYFRKELKPEELVRFHERLAAEPRFKQQFDTESLVHKALLFSREKERMRAYMAPAPALWLNNRALYTTGAAALAVWLISTFSSSLTTFSSEYIKWVGLAVAVVGSIAVVAYRSKTLNLRLAAVGLFNGLLVFVLASGFDAINHGAEDIADTDVQEAVLIPFTENKPWWPTESLEDSLEANLKRMNELRENIKAVVGARLGAGPYLNFAFAAGKFTPVVVTRTSTVVSGATYEADIFLATSLVVHPYEMSVDGKPIPMEADPSGVMKGSLRFTATANQFDKTGTATKKFLVAIKLRDSTYTKVVEYNVVKSK